MLSIGSALASVIGATVLVWAKGNEGVDFPGIGQVKPWQAAFLVVGAPGLIFAGLFFMIKEPVRQVGQLKDEALKGTSLLDMLAYVGARWKTYLSYVSLVCVMTIVAYSQGWFAPMFERTWGWDPEDYAIYNAMVTLAVGPATVYACGWLSDRLTGRGVADAPLRILIAGAFLLVPTGVAIPLMPSPELAFVVIAVNTIAIATVSSVSVTALLNITPAAIRAQTVALYYMTISLAGLFLGPTTVGYLSASVFGEDNLRYAVAVLPALFGIIPLLIVPITIRLYRRQMAILEGQRP